MSRPGAAPTRDANKWMVAITVLVGAIMAVLDSSIVNVALPSMSGTLGVTVEEITWVVTGYILSQVIVMPITGMLSLRFGRRNFYLFSVVLFTGASMLCGLARTLPLMAFFRVFQGFGGGVLLTVSQAILRETFPASQQGMAMGLYGMGVVVAPALGPTLGGWLTDQYSWPWIFLVNVPVGVLNVFLVMRYIKDPPYLKREKGRIDWAGLGLMTLGLGTLLLVLEKGEKYGWMESNGIMALSAVAAVSLTLFLWQELRLKKPAVNIRLLTNQSLASATALGGVLGMGLYGSLFLLPVFLQNLLGYTAMMSGQALIPRSLAMAVVMPISGRLYNRLGPRPLVLAGLLVSAFSFWELSHLTLDVSFWDIFWPQMWQGVGFGLIFVALSTAALATIPRAEMTEATGLYNVVRQVFGSVGITVSAMLLSRSALSHHAVLAEHVTAASLPAQHFLRGAAGLLQGHGADAGSARLGALQLLNGALGRQAAVLGFNDVFALIVVLFLAGLPLALFLRKNRLAADADLVHE